MCNQEVPLRICIFTRENVGEWETERSLESSLSFALRNKRKKHQPKRKMHGKLENIIKPVKNQHFAPSRPPRRSLARAIRCPHGALLGPQTTFQNHRASWGALGGLLRAPKSILEVFTGAFGTSKCAVLHVFCYISKACSFECFRPCPP